MKKPVDGPKIILASTSPRRRYLLKQSGLDFSVVPSRFNENSLAMSTPESYVRQLAEHKAKDVSQRHPDSWVIGADTIVLIQDTILGKPGSSAEAYGMLQKLGGNMHQVLTGYCICCQTKGRIFSDTVKTDVQFKSLSEKEIEWYIQTGEPFDKAGAYAIQGLGTFLVKSINGSYTSVVGLPVCEVIEFLIKEGVMEFRHE